jgi:hypothetical protein
MRRLLLVALCLAGCGYHLTGSGTTSTVPAGAHTISITLFHNRTRERGLEVRVRRAIEDEFRRHGGLRVVPEHEGDLVLAGSIRRFTSIPVAFSATDEAVQYQSVMQVEIRLVERQSGKVLFENKALQESQDFGVVSGVVIASSPHFQQGTINARDLTNLTNVQIGEARRHAAQESLLDLLAHDVYLQALEGF